MKKKFYRNTEEKMFSGTLAGLSDYFGLDPVLWRLLFIALCLATGGALLFVYIAAWVMVPPKPVIQPIDKSDYTVQ